MAVQNSPRDVKRQRDLAAKAHIDAQIALKLQLGECVEVSDDGKKYEKGRVAKFLFSSKGRPLVLRDKDRAKAKPRPFAFKHVRRISEVGRKGSSCAHCRP